VVAEGIETALSVATLAAGAPAGPVRAVAALSLNRLQGGWLRDEDGCVDLATSRPTRRPAFTWPRRPTRPGAKCWSRSTATWANCGQGPHRPRQDLWFLLTAEVRARICGRLAVAAWKAAGAPGRAPSRRRPGTTSTTNCAVCWRGRVASE
jgi:hypothetical protein